MKKKLLLMLSLVFCIVFMAGCGKQSDSDSVEVDDSIIDTCESNTLTNMQTWFEQDFQSTIDADQVSDDMIDKYESWVSLQKELGALKSYGDVETTISDDAITCTIEVTCEGGKATFTGEFDLTGTFTDVSMDRVYSMVETLQKALLNTLMGMGTVFVVLIMICYIIKGFGSFFVNRANKQQESKKTEAVQTVATPVVASSESEDVTDDLQLVAVVTAAIMASLGDEAPAEGLVVRSIRKRNTNKWKNA